MSNSEITHEGRRYVRADLFDAANRHVTEQGVYVNQVVGTMNRIGAERKTLRVRCADLERRCRELEQEVDRLNGELARVRELVRGVMF